MIKEVVAMRIKGMTECSINASLLTRFLDAGQHCGEAFRIAEL